MRAVAVVLFVSGLLLAIRVMFFGVQRKDDRDRVAHRAWPLALAGFLGIGGAMLYVADALSEDLSAGDLVAIGVVALAAAGLGRWFVKHSAALPSTDPDHDPRYRFQGHVARVTAPIGVGGTDSGRIAFDFDGRRYEMPARWAPFDGTAESQTAPVAAEVVIEKVEDDVAYVEPWAAVEKRL